LRAGVGPRARAPETQKPPRNPAIPELRRGLKRRGSGRSRTDDGGFAIRCQIRISPRKTLIPGRLTPQLTPRHRQTPGLPSWLRSGRACPGRSEQGFWQWCELRKGDSHHPPALSDRGVAAAPADEAERLGSLMEAEAIRPRWPNWLPSGTAYPMRSGQGSWPWCGRREGEAWLGDERSRTVPESDRQSSSPLAGLTLVAGPPSSGDEPVPRAATRIRCPSTAHRNPPPRPIPLRN